MHCALWYLQNSVHPPVTRMFLLLADLLKVLHIGGPNNEGMYLPLIQLIVVGRPNKLWWSNGLLSPKDTSGFHVVVK